MKEVLQKTLQSVADFYDRIKVGASGALGFRRSTDLSRLLPCLVRMKDQNLLFPGKTCFLDLGAADGRVNVLLSYLVKISVGIELDEWTWEEYAPLKTELKSRLMREGLQLPPKNISLFHGDSLDKTVRAGILEKTGVEFGQFDLFYTYLTMYEEFAGLISRRAKSGAVFMIYGLDRVLPRLGGFRLLTQRPLEGILALYEKV